MKTRVQYDREAGYHRHPADFSDSRAELPGAGGNAVFEDKTDSVESYSPCGDEDTPEVETCVAAEDVEDPNGKLNCHPEWNGSEDGDERPEHNQ